MDIGPTLCGLSSAVSPPRQAGIDMRDLFAHPENGAGILLTLLIALSMRGFLP
jgi:hypothetical protein